MKKLICYFALLLASLAGMSQTITSSTNQLKIDLRDDSRKSSTVFPRIDWVQPLNETVFQKEGKTEVKFQIESKLPLRKIFINVKDKNSSALHGTMTIDVLDSEKYSKRVERQVMLGNGVNEIEVIAENADGSASRSVRNVHVGETAMADAAKLARNDYALIVVTDKYDHWPSLTNPVFDGRTIARELERAYGFKVEILENPSQEMIWAKIREYAEKKYQPLDQLFVFFAGHGHFDETFREGYVVTKESLPNDVSNSSYVSHNRLRSNINNIPCDHIFLMMDVCFGGSFDEAIASARGSENVYTEISQSEFITRKLAFKTRKYITSGGKEYVSDGVEGGHSPFAKKFIDALGSGGGNDGILSLSELMTFVEKLNPEPKFGKFGSDAIGSEFVFVVKR